MITSEPDTRLKVFVRLFVRSFVRSSVSCVGVEIPSTMMSFTNQNQPHIPLNVSSFTELGAVAQLVARTTPALFTSLDIVRLLVQVLSASIHFFFFLFFLVCLSFSFPGERLSGLFTAFVIYASSVFFFSVCGGGTNDCVRE